MALVTPKPFNYSLRILPDLAKPGLRLAFQLLIVLLLCVIRRQYARYRKQGVFFIRGHIHDNLFPVLQINQNFGCIFLIF
jgi:hypothetical protein